MPSRPLQVVRPTNRVPASYRKALFLAGPSPRSPHVASWRPGALKILEELGYDGVVFVPEAESLESEVTYDDQADWEHRCLHLADAIVFWVPRELDTLPGFTTNVEFGTWLSSGKCIYGRPEGAPKTRYLDQQFVRETKQQPHRSLRDALAATVERLGEGAERKDGERWIPLQLWQTPMFRDWYASQRAAGNALREARLRWAFVLPGTSRLLAAVTWVDIWVAAENRAKTNEWIFGRSDISSVVLFERPEKRMRSVERLMDQPLVVVREFRSSARTRSGMVHELPGGSSVKEHLDPRAVAASEVQEETGLELEPERFVAIGSRQAAATVSTHQVHVYVAALSRPEMRHAERMARTGEVHGDASETERTVLEVHTLRQMLDDDTFDWSTLGMVLKALADWRTGAHPPAA